MLAGRRGAPAPAQLGDDLLNDAGKRTTPGCPEGELPAPERADGRLRLGLGFSVSPSRSRQLAVRWGLIAG